MKAKELIPGKMVYRIEAEDVHKMTVTPFVVRRVEKEGDEKSPFFETVSEIYKIELADLDGKAAAAIRVDGEDTKIGNIVFALTTATVTIAEAVRNWVESQNAIERS